MPETISSRIQKTGSRTSGFDYLRFSLAASIILWHGIVTSYGSETEIQYWRGPIGAIYHFVLPIFFSLSGFLVAGSLDRCPTLISFFSLRVLRIVPALSVEVTLSALIFGPLLTSLPLDHYFTDPQFFYYFLNLIGDIHYSLPGLFLGNPMANTVNAQLWTIPFELMCYLAIGGLAAAQMLRRRAIFVVFILALQAMWAWQALRLGDNGSSNGASGQVLIISFLSGIAFHLYRDKIRLGSGIFLAVLIVSICLSALPHGSYYLPIPATYITVYLGLLDPPHNRFLRSGDYSYGLYLYGFPLQQVVASYGSEAHHWWINVCVSMPAALAIAFCSWHFVERPAMSVRRYIPIFETALFRWFKVWRDRWLVRRPSLGAVLSVCVAVGGPLGTLLLVDVHEVAGAMVILLTLLVGVVETGLSAAPQQRQGVTIER